MNSLKTCDQRKRYKDATAFLRLSLTLILAIFVVYAQVNPATASHSSSANGAWIEICGEGGSYLAQLDDSGNTQTPDCDHCAFCLVPTTNDQGAYDINVATPGSLEFTMISYSADRAAMPDTPEQYWSACRGPPIASTEKNMTPTISLTTKEPFGSAFKAGESPCI